MVPVMEKNKQEGGWWCQEIIQRGEKKVQAKPNEVPAET